MRSDLTLGSGWPYGGAQVLFADAAGRLRFVRARRDGNFPIGAGAGSRCRREPTGGFSLSHSRPDCSRRKHPGNAEIKNGVVRIPAGLQGQYELLFFISSRTGMMVKRPAVGAEGFVLNHYDRVAVEAT